MKEVDMVTGSMDFVEVVHLVAIVGLKTDFNENRELIFWSSEIIILMIKLYLSLTKGCLICCCPPIGNMLLAEKMGLEEFQYKYLSLFDYIGGAGIFSFISAMLIRQKVRERYGIDGSNGGDCFVACCCTTCSICQMTKQVNEEK